MSDLHGQQRETNRRIGDGTATMRQAAMELRGGKPTFPIGPLGLDILAEWLESAANYCEAGQFDPTVLVHDRPLGFALHVLRGIES